MVVALVASSNQFNPPTLLLSNSSRSWVWLNNNNRGWGLLQEVPRWVNLDLEQGSSQDNLEARMVWAVSSFPTS